MPVRFRQPNGSFPTGGYVFSDPHTGMKFEDASVDINHQAKLVAEHRKGNPKIYNPDKPEHFDHVNIVQEIVIQTCSRVPQYCEDDARPGEPYPALPPPAEIETVQIQGKVCIKCKGQNFTPVRCKTCGGARISGYKCLSCGLEQ